MWVALYLSLSKTYIKISGKFFAKKYNCKTFKEILTLRESITPALVNVTRKTMDGVGLEKIISGNKIVKSHDTRKKIASAAHKERTAMKLQRRTESEIVLREIVL